MLRQGVFPVPGERDRPGAIYGLVRRLLSLDVLEVVSVHPGEFGQLGDGVLGFEVASDREIGHLCPLKQGLDLTIIVLQMRSSG